MESAHPNARLLDLVGLGQLVGRTSADASVRVGLVDGPVLASTHFAGSRIERIGAGFASSGCERPDAACAHGTIVAGLLIASRTAPVPGLCPGATLISRPALRSSGGAGGPPNATPKDVAAAIVDCVDAGVKVINLSVALPAGDLPGARELSASLDYAARREVLIVAAAGNGGWMASSVITRHPHVIPVVSCDAQGRPLAEATLSRTVGLQGLCAPGRDVAVLSLDGRIARLGGTSFAAPFVTGAAALLWSQYPSACVSKMRAALLGLLIYRRRSVAPPLLDAESARATLARISGDETPPSTASRQPVRAPAFQA